MISCQNSGGHVVDLCAFSAAVTDEMTGKMLNVFFSFADYKYDVIGIQLGGQHGFKKKCCVDLEYRNLWKQNYLRYVSEISRKCDNIFLISYTPTVLKENLESDNVERNEELACRNEIVREVAEEIGCPYIDLWDWILEKEYKHSDYIHFDKETNRQFADYMGRTIVNMLKVDKGIFEND